MTGATPPTTVTTITVRSWGIAGALRDGGRTGWAHLGRGRGGAVDLGALALANRLVGNDEGVAAIETSGGAVLAADGAVMVAVAGSPADLEVSAGPALGWGVATALPAGAVVRIGRLHGGARTYLAVRGGLQGADGPAADGTLVVGPAPASPPSGDLAVPVARGDVLRVWPGPRRDWFTDGAWAALTSGTYTVHADSDRVGARLVGAALRRRRTDELASEGVIEGAIQVPPDGLPIVMLADHPVTGGYPVIGVVDPDDLVHVAQAPAGATVRFRPTRTARAR